MGNKEDCISSSKAQQPKNGKEIIENIFKKFLQSNFLKISNDENEIRFEYDMNAIHDEQYRNILEFQLVLSQHKLNGPENILKVKEPIIYDQPNKKAILEFTIKANQRRKYKKYKLTLKIENNPRTLLQGEFNQSILDKRQIDLSINACTNYVNITFNTNAIPKLQIKIDYKLQVQIPKQQQLKQEESKQISRQPRQPQKLKPQGQIMQEQIIEQKKLKPQGPIICQMQEQIIEQKTILKFYISKDQNEKKYLVYGYQFFMNAGQLSLFKDEGKVINEDAFKIFLQPNFFKFQRMET